MAIDPTIPLRAGQGVQQPVNYLTMAGQAQNIASSALQNRLAVQARNADLAAGRDFQGAIGPDGQLNQSALNTSLANDPNAALSASRMSQEGLTNLQSQLAAKGVSLDQAVKKMSWANNTLGGLLAQRANGQPVSRSDVINAMASGVAGNVYSAKDIAPQIASVPEDQGQLDQWMKVHYGQTQNGLQALLPHVQMLNNGQRNVPVNTNAVAGPVGAMQGNAIQNQLSPSEAAQPVTLPTSSGASQITSLGQFEKAANGGQQPNIVATGQSTQQAAANQAVGTAQGNQASSFFADATNLAQTRAALQGIRVELPNATGGPLAQSMRNVGAALGELGLKNMDQATAYDLLQKGQAQVVVSRVSDGLGVPTDSKMQAVSAQTPGTHMTGAAGAVAVGQIEGVLDYNYARAKAAQQSGVINNPAQSSQFNLDWQKRFPNASVFQFQYLPKNFQQKYWHSMSQGEQAAFKQQYRDAAEAGFVQPSPFNK